MVSLEFRNTKKSPLLPHTCKMCTSSKSDNKIEKVVFTNVYHENADTYGAVYNNKILTGLGGPCDKLIPLICPGNWNVHQEC